MANIKLTPAQKKLLFSLAQDITSETSSVEVLLDEHRTARGLAKKGLLELHEVGSYMEASFTAAGHVFTTTHPEGERAQICAKLHIAPTATTAELLNALNSLLAAAGIDPNS